ncbi:MAG: peptide deformylase [Mycoplasmatales bacterium]|nr:peptide deformylase [Mycoplasmatales bacterium]
MNLTMLPDKKVRTKSKNLDFPLSKEKIDLINGMINHIDDSQKPGTTLRPGVGIAAVQVGHLDRMFYISAPESDGYPEWKEFFINPVITKKSSKAALRDGEGCLSVGTEIPLQDGLVHRYMEVTIKGYSYFQGKEITVTRKGYHAIIIQHEYDHLEGKLFIDRIDKFNKWKQLNDEVLL